GVWQAFERQHRTEYGHVFADSPVEIVNIRLTGAAVMPKIGRPPPPADGTLEAARLRTGPCSFRADGRLARFDTPYYRRDAIPAGCPFEGPAVVVQRDTTTVVPPGWTAAAQADRNLILQREG
ncbi:MAG: hydantoinase/oxoprolinase family protein, partial [Rhodospirillaceae bacterium]|nr:hydantoinase/oxoprolinase family protein [Rhodospirillaceae bacterium]